MIGFLFLHRGDDLGHANVRYQGRSRLAPPARRNHIYMDRDWDRGRTVICLELPVRVLLNGVRSELEAKLLRS